MPASRKPESPTAARKQWAKRAIQHATAYQPKPKQRRLRTPPPPPPPDPAAQRGDTVTLDQYAWDAILATIQHWHISRSLGPLIRGDNEHVRAIFKALLQAQRDKELLELAPPKTTPLTADEREILELWRQLPEQKRQAFYENYVRPHTVDAKQGLVIPPPYRRDPDHNR